MSSKVSGKRKKKKNGGRNVQYGNASSLGLSNFIKKRKGISFTCNRGREKIAIREISNVLGDVFSSEKDDDDDDDVPKDKKEDENISAADQLAIEIKKIKEQSKKNPFDIIATGMDGILICRFNGETTPDPDEIVSSLFRSMIRDRKALFRECVRIYPMQVVTSATIEHIVQAARELITKYLPKGVKKTFRIVFRRTLCQSVKRSEVIENIASLVDSSYTVDLKRPDWTILIQSMKSICGITISPHHHAMHDYNVNILIRSFSESERSRKCTRGSDRESSKRKKRDTLASDHETSDEKRKLCEKRPRKSEVRACPTRRDAGAV